MPGHTGFLATTCHYSGPPTGSLSPVIISPHHLPWPSPMFSSSALVITLTVTPESGWLVLGSRSVTTGLPGFWGLGSSPSADITTVQPTVTGSRHSPAAATELSRLSGHRPCIGRPSPILGLAIAHWVRLAHVFTPSTSLMVITGPGQSFLQSVWFSPFTAHGFALVSRHYHARYAWSLRPPVAACRRRFEYACICRPFVYFALSLARPSLVWFWPLGWPFSRYSGFNTVWLVGLPSPAPHLFINTTCLFVILSSSAFVRHGSFVITTIHEH